MAVNLSPVGGVAAQFLDNNGNPLVGGKLYSYAAGTTTPQTTFTSSSGGTANSNPIILNAGGRVPNEIWLTDGSVYKFVLYDSNDVLIGSWDNIVGINSNFVNFVTSEEVQVATAGQTVFTLTTMTYQPGTNNLVVYVDGVNQVEGGLYSFVETDNATVTFTSGLHVGAVVKFVSAESLTTIGSNASLVVYEPAGAGAVITNVQAKLRETVSVKDFGAVGDGVTDDTVAIQAAIATGFALVWPAGTYRLTQSIICTSDQSWSTPGKVTVLYDAANGSAIAPVFDFRNKIFVLGDFIVDQQANSIAFTAPTIYGGEAGAGSAILVQGDYSNIDGITVKNAWGNGIFVAKYTNPSVSTFVAGSPKYVSLANIKTIDCGVGDKQGGGIDVGSGSLCVVSNCVDNGSYNGFILDTGASGQCMFVNCQAFQTKRDALVAGSGHGFYVGGADSTFANCYSYLSEYRGWWHDTGQNIEYVNCAAYVPEYEGLYMKSGIATFTNFRVKNASAVGLNVADAILIDSSAAAIGLVSIDARIIGTNHRYAVNTTGANNINIFVSGTATAATAVVPTLAANHYVGTNFQSETTGGLWGFNKNVPAYTHDILGRTRLTAGVANTSYIVDPFGDVTGNGTHFVEDFATNAKRAAWGYDPVNDCFVMQSIHAGVAVKPFFINPSGGDVMVGTGVWTSPMRLGAYRLWVDGSGVLRIKNGAPSSDGDGTVVGTQT